MDIMHAISQSPGHIKLGSRVRILLPGGGVCDEAPHYPEEEGAVGQVIGITPVGMLLAHPYLVLFDYPLLCSLWGRCSFEIPARHYAEDEIRPV